MRSNHWKLLGGAGLAAGVALLIIGRSGPVAGEPAEQDQFEATMPIGEPQPGEPYGLGPNAIPYEAQSVKAQDNIDKVYETLEASQPAASHEAFARAADQAVMEAQAQIAARYVGLENVEEQGVVP